MTIVPDARAETQPDETFTLGDRYTAEAGEILATGVQAIVRIPLDQMRADRRNGHNTATFIAGYQGSPLGGFDLELGHQRKLLDEFHIVHKPAVNEELGATAVMGSQTVMLQKNATVDGVLGIWYGKAPGLDRAGDAIRHATWAGTSRLGGVLALTGDDPACKSSTLPSRSDVMLAGLGLPVLYPGSTQDVLDLGAHGVAMSRLSGMWVAFKVVTPVADGTGVAVVDPYDFTPVLPTYEVNGKPFVPRLSAQLVTPNTNSLEVEVLGHRMELVRRYIAANPINKVIVDGPSPWLGIVAAGHIAEQVMEALATLGIPASEAPALGIRVLKLGAITPLDGDAVRRLAAGVKTVLVVEDKTPFLETMVRDALYQSTERPAVLGKLDADRNALVPYTGALNAAALIEPLRRVLATTIAAERLAPVRQEPALRMKIPVEAVRTPYFCSGCPHNTSTLAPEGALVGAGIGCHGMVALIGGDATNRGEIIGLTQMGGEGSQWIGTAPFIADKHLFQNLGDGTFFHSGQLSIQYAVSAGVDMTFKLLYNAAVAMTGGQDAAGVLPVPDVARKLLSEGVKDIIITTDEPEKYRDVSLPTGSQVWHRDRIIEAQEHLRKQKGVTVLIHDQQCAAEKRRDRKRGILAMPEFKVMIDERVCEGCGDCGVQSNCLSLQPIDTEFGRKTSIDQTSCNLDVSCLKGDCPAFISVKPSKRATDATKRAEVAVADLREPVRITPSDGVTIRMPGIGGTGVVTVSQMLGAAAKIDGLDANGLDQTGLSQKAGPVVSSISLGNPAAGRLDVLLAFDLLVSVTPANLAGLSPDHSVVIANSHITPTGRMVGKVATSKIDTAPFYEELESRSVADKNRYVDAARITSGLFGNAVTANVFVVGVAYQSGLLPITAESFERAIELNGTAVESNRQAFRWGRMWVLDPTKVETAAGVVAETPADLSKVAEFAADPELQRLVAVRLAELTTYQNARYASRYLDTVRHCFVAEQRSGGDGSFTRVVAHQLHRVMAYKDEYEVARLLLDGRGRINRVFGGADKVVWNLHPPTLRAMGLGRKMKFGAASRPAFLALRAAKGLRGTPLDPFGRAKVRREERALIGEYDALVRSLAATPSAEATRVAGLIDQVRGYETVKLRNLAAYRTALAAETSTRSD
jgi:indolepyruvate ferredoxin oxidoreductase